MVKQRLNYVFKSQSMVVLIFLLFASAVSLSVIGGYSFIRHHSAYLNVPYLLNAVICMIQAFLRVFFAVSGIAVFRQAKNDNGDMRKILKIIKAVSLIFAVLFLGYSVYSVFANITDHFLTVVSFFDVPFMIFLKLSSVSVSSSSLIKTLSTGENIRKGFILFQVSSFVSFLLKLFYAGLCLTLVVAFQSQTPIFDMCMLGLYVLEVWIDMMLFYFSNKCYTAVNNKADKVQMNYTYESRAE